MRTVRLTLVVDPTACDGHGVCAELFPEGIAVDRWGYPVVRDAGIPAGLEDAARTAVEACPRLALHVVERRP